MIDYDYEDPNNGTVDFGSMLRGKIPVLTIYACQAYSATILAEILIRSLKVTTV
jgi:hypothetical protein